MWSGEGLAAIVDPFIGPGLEQACFCKPRLGTAVPERSTTLTPVHFRSEAFL
jgi:hypothetical protein